MNAAAGERDPNDEDNDDGKIPRHDDKAEGGDSDDDAEKQIGGDHRKMKRVLANRNSARASYQRRKKLISDLQSMAAGLSEKNSVLVGENKRLRSELQELKQQMNFVLFSSSNNSRETACNHSLLGGTSVANSVAHQNTTTADLLSRLAGHQQQSSSSPLLSQTMGLTDLPALSAPAPPQAGDLQRALLANQIRLARSLGLPPPHGM